MFEFLLQIGGALAVLLRGGSLLGLGKLVVGGFDGGVEAGQLAGVRRRFGVELVEARAGFLIAVGVGVIGDETALLDEPDAAFDKACSFGLKLLDGLFDCGHWFSFRC